jgi:hypothetical protein
MEAHAPRVRATVESDLLASSLKACRLEFIWGGLREAFFDRLNFL